MPSTAALAFRKETLLASAGYDPRFVTADTPVALPPVLGSVGRAVLPEVEGADDGLLRYTALTVAYHAGRRVPILAASNIDGRQKRHNIRRASGFRPDPRIDADIQLSQRGFYDLRTDITEFEIGHMAANDELAWGPDAQLKAYQTFHFPNSVPQAEKLNSGIWRSLEGYIIREAATLPDNKRISVFTGPVLRDEDPLYRLDPKFQIPLLFYKVIVFPTPIGLRSTGFLMSHEQRMREQGMFLVPDEGTGDLELAVPPHFGDYKYRKVFQVNLRVIEDLTGLTFRWRGVRRIAVPGDRLQVQKIRAVRDAADASDYELGTVGDQETRVSDQELTSREERTGQFRLRILLG